MFETGTILVLDEPRSTDDKKFPYDRVEVIGASPVLHASTITDGDGNTYSGLDAQGVLIRPAGEEFAPNLDEPYGKLVSLYSVESFPPADEEIARPGSVRKVNPGPSPEQQFTSMQKEATKERERKTEGLTGTGKTPEQLLREKEGTTETQGAAKARRSRRAKPDPEKVTK